MISGIWHWAVSILNLPEFLNYIPLLHKICVQTVKMNSIVLSPIMNAVALLFPAVVCDMRIGFFLFPFPFESLTLQILTF